MSTGVTVAQLFWGWPNCDWIWGELYRREYKPAQKPMTGKDMGPSGEYITMSLLNEHVIKLTSKYWYFTHRPGTEEFLSTEVEGS